MARSDTRCRRTGSSRNRSLTSHRSGGTGNCTRRAPRCAWNRVDRTDRARRDAARRAGWEARSAPLAFPARRVPTRDARWCPRPGGRQEITVLRSWIELPEVFRPKVLQIFLQLLGAEGRALTGARRRCKALGVGLLCVVVRANQE